MLGFICPKFKSFSLSSCFVISSAKSPLHQLTPCYTASIFSLSFIFYCWLLLLQPSHYALPSLPMNIAALSLEGLLIALLLTVMTAMTCGKDRIWWYWHALSHCMPCSCILPHHILAPTHAALLCLSPTAHIMSLGLCYHMSHVTLPLIGAHTTSPCSLC